MSSDLETLAEIPVSASGHVFFDWTRAKTCVQLLCATSYLYDNYLNCVARSGVVIVSESVWVELNCGNREHVLMGAL